jgi:hypothetical protein
MGNVLPGTPREWVHSAANKSDGRTARRMEAMSAQRGERERLVTGAASVQRGEWLIMKDESD